MHCRASRGFTHGLQQRRGRDGCRFRGVDRDGDPILVDVRLELIGELGEIRGVPGRRLGRPGGELQDILAERRECLG